MQHLRSYLSSSLDHRVTDLAIRPNEGQTQRCNEFLVKGNALSSNQPLAEQTGAGFWRSQLNERPSTVPHQTTGAHGNALGVSVDGRESLNLCFVHVDRTRYIHQAMDVLTNNPTRNPGPMPASKREVWCRSESQRSVNHRACLACGSPG